MSTSAEGKDTKPTPTATAAATNTTSETKTASTPSTPSTTSSNGSNECSSSLCGGPLGKEVCRLLLWNDIQRSGIVFGCGILYWFLVTCGGYTAVTLAAYIVLLQVIVCFTYINGTKLYLQYVKGQTMPKMRDDPAPLVTREQVEAYVTPLLATSNALINIAVKLARCEDNIETAKAAAALWVISIIGRCFSTMTLVGLTFIIAFTIPKLYLLNKDQSDRIIAIAAGRVRTAIAQLIDRVPVLKGKPKSE